MRQGDILPLGPAAPGALGDPNGSFHWSDANQVAITNPITPTGDKAVTIAFSVNGKDVNIAAEADTPLLWVLRDDLGMTGTKFGCGIAACGACSVHVDGALMRSCSVPVSEIAGKAVTTIEGLKRADGTLNRVQQAWIDAQVPQCGYCQSGQIMAAVALIEQVGTPTDAQIDDAMTNICRCGTYPRIRTAILAATQGAGAVALAADQGEA
jgi:isoquinoline 1-oxidoreductase alpha subunit